MTGTSPHTSHPDIINRPKRAMGHIRFIIEMLEAGRSCLDLAQQLQAVGKAVAQTRKALIHDHINPCLAVVFGPLPRDQRARIEEFKLTLVLVRLE